MGKTDNKLDTYAKELINMESKGVITTEEKINLYLVVQAKIFIKRNNITNHNHIKDIIEGADMLDEYINDGYNDKYILKNMKKITKEITKLIDSV